MALGLSKLSAKSVKKQWKEYLKIEIKNKKMKEGYYVFLLAGVDARL